MDQSLGEGTWRENRPSCNWCRINESQVLTQQKPDTFVDISCELINTQSSQWKGSLSKFLECLAIFGEKNLCQIGVTLGRNHQILRGGIPTLILCRFCYLPLCNKINVGRRTIKFNLTPLVTALRRPSYEVSGIQRMLAVSLPHSMETGSGAEAEQGTQKK